MHQLRLNKDEHLHKAFRHFDRDQSGFISRRELQSALEYQGGISVDVESILRDIDSDRDGRINYEEFCNCLRVREADANTSLGQLINPAYRSRQLERVLNSSLCRPGVRVNNDGSPPEHKVLEKSSSASLTSSNSRCSRKTEPGNARVHFKEAPDVFKPSATLPASRSMKARAHSDFNGTRRRSYRQLQLQQSRRGDGLFNVLLQSSRALTGTASSSGLSDSRRRSRAGLITQASRRQARRQPSGGAKREAAVRVVAPIDRVGRARSRSQSRSRSGSRTRPQRSGRPSDTGSALVMRDASYSQMYRSADLKVKSGAAGVAHAIALAALTRVTHPPSCITSRPNSREPSRLGSRATSLCGSEASATSQRSAVLVAASPLSLTGRSPSVLLPAVSRKLYQKAASLQSREASQTRLSPSVAAIPATRAS